MTDTSPPSNSGEQPEPSRSCHKCKKTEVELSRCERCETRYCSRSCQIQDWKSHKKTCARSRGQPASSSGTPSSSSSAQPTPSTAGLQQHVSDPFTRIDNGTYLRDRPEADVYKLLIDTYRLRMDDNLKFDGIREPDCLYAAGVTDSLPGFRRFLTLIQAKVPSVLPTWWNDDKQAACEAVGAATSGWSSLRRKLDKAAVQAHYKNDRFPMQLRMFGETIYGRGVGGQDGTTMRRLMMQQETGGGGAPHVAHLDAGPLFDRFRQQFG